MTRRRSSVCERLDDPPRIMFTRPASRTMTTAATATMDRTCRKESDMARAGFSGGLAE
jgi:hypothetical protein